MAAIVLVEEDRKRIAAELRDRINGLTLPADLRVQLDEVFKRLGGDLAVRSSATVEDSRTTRAEAFMRAREVHEIFRPWQVSKEKRPGVFIEDFESTWRRRSAIHPLFQLDYAAAVAVFATAIESACRVLDEQSHETTTGRTCDAYKTEAGRLRQRLGRVRQRSGT